MTAIAPRASTAGEADQVRRRFAVRGVVQGVGFRPFVYLLATGLGLRGQVRNDDSGVQIEVEGPPAQVEAFALRLRGDAPPLAVIESITVESITVESSTVESSTVESSTVESITVESTATVEPAAAFRIVESIRDRSADATGGRTLAAADVATCADCLRELNDPADRRYRHPFITCTNCGPRFTIICELPYDRPLTTMAKFPMCADCAREYGDPADRRFHAQPICCPNCGPTLELVHGPGGSGRLTGEEALAGARELLAAGAIIAVKGLGGYHLACDAGNERAVSTLRRRKARGDKPFAVMVPDLDTARRLAVVGDLAAALLTGTRRPIVLLPRGTDAGLLAPAVAPGSPDLGLMLPYTPLHTLMLAHSGGECPGALVMTSGNLGGEPIVTGDEEALLRLAGLADAWLRHDRPIRVPCDDSVTAVVDGEELPIRRSRGYAPLPVALPIDVPATFAAGADLKNTCAVGDGRRGWLSQHVGDMDDERTLAAFTSTEAHLRMLTGTAPTRFAADQHPGYRSTAWARRERDGRELYGVQHHHAHIASVMAEHGLDGSRPVIGIAFDGTGYGTDRAVWGGEVLIADYQGFHRGAHLRYVPLPGGDASVRRPYRMALAHLYAAGVPWAQGLPCVAACPPEERRVLAHQLRTGLGCVPTSSIGRLFDAVSSLAGVRHVADYEAQAAIELEGLSRDAGPSDAGPSDAGPSDAGGRWAGGYLFGEGMDAAPVIRAVAADAEAGVAPEVIGARFHAGLVALVLSVASHARAATGLTTVALSGGVFQNALLLAGSCRALRADGFTVLRHRLVPPNDGGLALGQLVVAASAR
ncbi:MAG TPA: carbamoyltransferase HypF, partial [Jatrophihabitantaceae bacterium]|nr:carbamoyltransferase HypF [Jatrophihabitantaceae bacterium]